MILIMNIIKNPTKMEYTSVTNLYHLFYIYNIKEVLVDKQTKEYVNSVFDTISKLQVDFNIEDAIEPDYISCKKLKSFPTDANEYILNAEKNFKQKYDLFVVHEDNFKSVLPLLHRVVFIYIVTGDHRIVAKDGLYLPYTKVNDCFDGVLYINEFHSMIFPYINLNVFQQTYLRDKPYRYLMKTISLIETVLGESDGKRTIVEIGSCRSKLNHPLHNINPMCCNDSHSTFFWCLIPNGHVTTVDVNPYCSNVINSAVDGEYVEIKGTLDVITADGLNFLKKYKSDSIDFLFLDSWDVVVGNDDYAKKHLEAYEMVKDKLSNNVMIAIDDTDIANGGKGRLLIPKLLEDSFFILLKGRHTILYKGDITRLFNTVQ